MPAALAFFSGESQFEQPTAAIAAASVVVTIPVIIVVLMFQRRIVAGLTGGAVKGLNEEEYTMSEISIRNVTKRFGGDDAAVDDVSLEIADGEFVILVGPSGSGKSTLLQMIVGLLDITEGDVYIGGERMNDKAPRDRGLAMVFQDYALYPHLTVFENMAFPLRLRHASGDEIKQPRRADGRDARAQRLPRPQAGATSPAASASASPWVARWCETRTRSSSTSRCRTSTPSCAPRCGRRSRAYRRSSGRRRSTSPTTRWRR